MYQRDEQVFSRSLGFIVSPFYCSVSVSREYRRMRSGEGKGRFMSILLCLSDFLKQSATDARMKKMDLALEKWQERA